MHQSDVRKGTQRLLPNPTPFVGRENEIIEITRLLADSNCRLLTLVGPGGIGKTRLAVQVVSPKLNEFADGVYFVDLQPVQTCEFLIHAIADALNLPLSGHQPPDEQLLNALRDREMLLLLDNFEQLLEDGGETLLSRLVNECPGLHLVVTSREVLNLRQEWVWHVAGMAYPEQDEAASQASYDAVKFFAERARRVQSDFSLERDLGDVIQICQLVAGMPLAIELAAGWLKTFSCKTIVQEIRHNLDFLSTRLRDIPDRHRSMRVVFEQAWRLLSPEERYVMNHLSVFRGGFGREAAEQVAGATLAILSSLTDKSLLQRRANERFQMHELLRQYAAEQLNQSPDGVDHVFDAHCAYYMDFLYRRDGDVQGGRQRQAAQEIEAELENIRAAWQWAIERGQVEALSKAFSAYGVFCQLQGRYLESATFSKRAWKRLLTLPVTPQTDQARVEILSGLGWSHIRLGQLDQAEAAFKQSQEIYQRLGIAPTLGYITNPEQGLAIIALVKGNYAEAEQLAHHALLVSEAEHYRPGVYHAYYELAGAVMGLGQYETARRYAQQAYRMTQEDDDRWFMAYCLNVLGEIAARLDDYGVAKGHFEAMYALREELNEPEGMALALNHLGELAGREGRYETALRHYQHSRSLYQKIGDRGGLAKSLHGIGNTSLMSGDYAAAARYLRQAFQVAAAVPFVPVLFQLFVAAGELLLQTGYRQAGLKSLALALRHASSDHDTRTASQRLLVRYGVTELTPTILASIEKHDLSSVEGLISAASELEPLLMEIEQQPNTDTPQKTDFIPVSSQPLLDPLSERELEVLNHMAAGLQNREIADRLTVSLNTVKTHINNIYRKLDVNNRVQAVARARELSLL